jgi:hypothetical protein
MTFPLGIDKTIKSVILIEIRFTGAITMLGFSKGNSKMNVLAKHLGLSKNAVLSFDIPAGWTCAKADICKGYADEKTGKLTQVGRVKCYAVKQENYLPSVRAFRWNNFNQLLACGRDNTDGIAELILSSIPKSAKIIRIQSSGDFYSEAYFMAWVRVAYLRPDITFIAYSKHLDYVTFENRSSNFSMVYSYGSKDDARYNENYSGYTLPTCFIEEFEGQYGSNFPRVCATHAEGWQDFFCITFGSTFVIPIH